MNTYLFKFGGCSRPNCSHMHATARDISLLHHCNVLQQHQHMSCHLNNIRAQSLLAPQGKSADFELETRFGMHMQKADKPEGQQQQPEQMYCRLSGF